MNINFEKVEKAWFKPKNTALDELEEWAKANQYIGKTIVFENDLTHKAPAGARGRAAETRRERS